MSGIGIEQVAAYYGRVPEHLLLDPDVSDAECRLYALLTTYDRRRAHEVWPTQATLGERLGWSERTVRRVIGALRDHKAIEVQQRRRAPAIIRLVADLIPLDLERPDLAGQEPRPDNPGRQDRPDRGNVPLTNETKNEKARSGARTTDARADEIVRVWWESHDPRPLQPWPAAVKIVSRALAAGYTEPTLVEALRRVDPPLSGGKLDQALSALRARRRVGTSPTDPGRLS